MKSSTLLKTILLPVVCFSPLAVRGAVFFDNFDSYTAGSQLHGQAGWKGWDNVPAAGAVVSNAFSASPSNSVNITGGSDLVHTFSGATSGVWTFSALQYIPTGATGDSYIILLNIYNDGGPDDWSVQTHMNMGTNQVISDYGGGTLPIIRDQWVPFRADIDLTANTVSEYYNGALLQSHTWTSGAGSALAIAALDLYANNATPVYYDNVTLVPESSSLALLAVGLVAMSGRRRRC